MDKKKKKEKWLDRFGAGCGILLLIVAILCISAANAPARAGVPDKEVPAEAQTLTGTAAGRNGDITVTVVATEDKLWQIKVTEQSETEGIGSVAVKELPATIFQNNSLKVDAVSGATLSSDGIRNAIVNALENGGIDPANFGAAKVLVEVVAEQVQTHSGVTVIHAADWAEQFPNEYNSWNMTSEESEVEDYLEIYPMLSTLYEPYGFSFCYGSARGHYYDVDDILETTRPHKLAQCWTCKTPDFTNLANELGPEAYLMDFEEVHQKYITEGISCYSCHANNPGVLTVTHTYLIDAVGEDFDKIDAADLACGQCHNEYFFFPETGVTTLPHTSLASMSPDAILAYYNDGSNFPSGEPFTDYTNPRTGVKQIKVQHPELETFLGEGSQHRNTYTCADCHMPAAVAEDGTAYSSHHLISPLDNPDLIENECSKCHADLISEVHETQQKIENRTYSIGYELEHLTELLADAVESGKFSDKKLENIRSLARDAQFYWDFVFVENAEGAHNPALTNYCLDKAEELCNQAINELKALTGKA